MEYNNEENFNHGDNSQKISNIKRILVPSDQTSPAESLACNVIISRKIDQYAVLFVKALLNNFIAYTNKSHILYGVYDSSEASSINTMIRTDYGCREIMRERRKLNSPLKISLRFN